jgi:hypothetical protein
MENTSGQGKSTIVPEEIKQWNWGGFLLNWIWSVGNNTWIGLLVLLPYVGIVMAFVLGFKGNEWAWKNRKWDSIEHFQRVQKKWSYWGVVIYIFCFVAGISVVLIFG